jgi:Uma2 family endonuclease
MAQTALHYVSANEFLQAERSAKEKHELHQGHVVAMAGASLAHNEIVANLIGNIKTHLKGRPCRIYPSDLRVAVATTDSFTYPDASIVCGKPKMLDSTFDTLVNPAVLIEVMSTSTEQYDRGTKFFYYMQIPSLKEYILISSTTKFAQTAIRQQDGSWKFEEVTSGDAFLPIQTIEYKISMEEIYENVEF